MSDSDNLMRRTLLMDEIGLGLRIFDKANNATFNQLIKTD